jgi:cytochrome bd-type quinol oxidase subunit 2
LILYCLIFRGASIEVGGHAEDRLWQQLWDFVSSAASLLLAENDFQKVVTQETNSLYP